jgi:hypothetical protein
MRSPRSDPVRGYYYCAGGMASFIFPQKYIAVAYVLGRGAH